MLHAREIASAPRAPADRTVWALTVAACVLAAAALRVLAAQGDLWLDEIWSLSLIAEAGSIPAILFDVSHDNNHYLNSLWLFVTGPDAPVLAQRGLSIVMGAATVVAAGLVFRGDRITQAVAMVLAAVAAPLVHYGSEARGYAGLALFACLAFAMTARLIEEPGSRARIGLAVATGLGLLSHLTFVAALGVAGLWMAVELWRRSNSIRLAERTTLAAFAPALAAALAVGLCVVAGALQGGFSVGGVTPFTFGGFVEGYGGMLRATLGLPDAVPAALVLAALAAGLAMAVVRPGLVSRRFAPLYVVGLAVLPATMALAQLPNANFGRYFLVSGVVLLIFLADLIGLGLRGGSLARSLSAVALGAMVVGHASRLVTTHDGRGQYADAVALMGREGDFTYGSDSPFRTEMTLGYHAERLGIRAAPVPFADWCASRPAWIVLEQPLPLDADGSVGIDARDCTFTVEKAASFPARGFSGIAWTVYRVVESRS